MLTVQREVAERMVAQPPDMSLLALGVQFYATGKIVATDSGGRVLSAAEGGFGGRAAGSAGRRRWQAT